MGLRLVAGLFLLVPPLAAAELHADGAVDTRIGLGTRWDVIVHNRARVVAKTGDWYDVSLIPILRYQVHPRVTVFGGSFFTWCDFPNTGWRRVDRPFIGVEPAIFKGERFMLTSRTGYERFMVHDGPDYNRCRQRVRITGNGKWSPYASIEFFFTNQGFATTRYGTGVRRDLGRHDGIEFFYWYETGKITEGGIRHMISVTFHLRFKGFAPNL